MRLICPNCGAQYEVPDDVIPEAGRDVQCSNCGTTWFELPGASERAEDEGVFAEPTEEIVPDTAPEQPEVEAEAPEEPDAPLEDDYEDELDDIALRAQQETSDFDDEDDDLMMAAPVQRPRRSLDPEIASILREEAERETEKRKRETESAFESQPDLGLDASPVDNRAEEAARRMSRLRGEPEPVADIPRKERLPDIEEINSTLRSNSERDDTILIDTPVAAAKANRSGFRTGFFGMCITAGIAAATYIFAGDIGEMIPPTDAPLAGYTAWVDGLRIKLDGLVQSVLTNMNG